MSLTTWLDVHASYCQRAARPSMYVHFGCTQAMQVIGGAPPVRLGAGAREGARLHTWYGFRGNNAGSNGSLNGHFELLAGDELLQACCQGFAHLVGRVLVHYGCQRIYCLHCQASSTMLL